MIAPALDTRDLSARLDALMAQLRALARNKISYRKGRKGHAKDARAFERPHRLGVLRVPIAPFALAEVPPASIPEIRAALIAAARETLPQ